MFILGPFNYFGEEEILKKQPFRTTQAKCVSEELVIFEINWETLQSNLRLHK
jgi:hypothetical protein